MAKLIFIFLFLFSSCSVFKTKTILSEHDRWMESWRQACATSEGKGQLFFNKKPYSFSYESVFNEEGKFWALALDVPLRGEESLIVPYDPKQTFEGSLLANRDEKSKKKINEATLLAWKKSWLSLLIFLKQREVWAETIWKTKETKSSGTFEKISWKYSIDEITLTSKSNDQSDFTWNFKKTGDDFFYNQQTVTLRHQKTLQTISLHLYPTTCRK